MSKSVLIIDQDASVSQLVGSILGPKGYEVESCSGGQAALELLKSKDRAVVVVGDQLDDLDGIGFIVQLRKSFAKLKVVLVTKSWPPAELYERLTKDLKVSLVAIRPLKASVFGAQVDALLNEEKAPEKKSLSPEELHFEAMQALRSKYIIVLPERIKKLTESFDAARAERTEPRHLDEAIRLAHNLKGTAGSCGLLELSEASAHLEAALKSIKAAGLSENETSWDETNTFLDYVAQVANVISSSTTSEALEVGTRLRNLAHGPGLPPTDDRPDGIIFGISNEPPAQPPVKAVTSIAALENNPISGAATLSRMESELGSKISSGRRQREGELVPHPVSPGVVAEDGALDLLPLSEDATSIRVLIMSSEEIPPLERKADGLPVQLIGTHSPEDALVTARTLALDAVLVDIDMASPAPGITLARNIRSLPGNENLPVAFVSTNKQAGNADAAHAGASLYLQKPIVQQMLSNAVDYLLSVRTGGRPRILIIDDDEDFTRVISSILGKEGMIVKAVCVPENVPEIVAQFAPDIVLLDVMMPGVSGYQICQQIREKSQFQDLPVLFLTAQTGLSARLAAFEAGGDDYLPKPVAPAELLMRVKVRLERARLLKERADKDVLTGLMIRRAFMEQLQALALESKNNNLRFSLCLLDIDHFKKVNDSYGHLAGDRVLSYFGQLIRRRFRVDDLRGRWGGEEFIVAFRHIEKETAQGALERCLEELKGHVFEGDHGEVFSVSFSAGLVSFPEDGEVPQNLIKFADVCLYEAKRNGRSQVVARIPE